MSTKEKQGRTAPDPRGTKDLILDAAERMFAEHGFYGVTIREVFKTAGLNSGLMTYYFSSKEDMFTQAILRRLPLMKDRFQRLFGDLHTRRADGPRSPEESINLYIRFFLEAAFAADNDLRNYVVLLANSASSYEESLVADLLRNFDFITDRMISELSAALPYANEDQLREGLFYLESSIATIMLTKRFRQRRLAHQSDDSIQALSISMAAFFTQGTLALISAGPRR